MMSFYIYKGCFIYVPTMLSTEVMTKLTFLVSVAAILDLLNLIINR